MSTKSLSCSSAKIDIGINGKKDKIVSEEISNEEAETDKFPRLNPVARVLLQGVYDENSPLSKLSGTPNVLQMIWNMIKLYWKSLIKSNPPDTEEEDECGVAYLPYRNAPFPTPQGINISMMPFIMGRTFKECHLPKYLKPYWKMIVACGLGSCCFLYPHEHNEIGSVGFLTIHESLIEEGGSQRRAGVHTENPGRVFIEEIDKNGDEKSPCKVCIVKGGGSSKAVESSCGRGWISLRRASKVGGIYMASTVDDSFKIWDCHILQDKDGSEIIGEMGDIEHLQAFLPQSEKMKKNRIYWLTDRTPQESLPLKKGTYMQFLKLVTNEVSLWFEEHSTKNPKGIVPDPKVTKIVKGSRIHTPEPVIPVENESQESGKSCCCS